MESLKSITVILHIIGEIESAGVLSKILTMLRAQKNDIKFKPEMIGKNTLIKSYNIAFDLVFMVIEKTFPIALRKITR